MALPITTRTGPHTNLPLNTIRLATMTDHSEALDRPALTTAHRHVIHRPAARRHVTARPRAAAMTKGKASWGVTKNRQRFRTHKMLLDLEKEKKKKAKLDRENKVSDNANDE